MTGETVKVEVLWGSFVAGGGWLPNPRITMSSDEQFAANDATIRSGGVHAHLGSMEEVMRVKS